MPDRLIRDELMRSHRYVTLTSDTLRVLFVHFVLSADGLGNAEATTTAISLIMARPIENEVASRWLTELGDVDLVRVYESGGKRYVHIPRFRQRLRYLRGKHPRPPANIECKEIKELLAKVRPQSDCSRTVVGLQSAEVKRSEEKKYLTNKESTKKRQHASDQGERKRLLDLIRPKKQKQKPQTWEETERRRKIGEALKQGEEEKARAVRDEDEKK